MNYPLRKLLHVNITAGAAGVVSKLSANQTTAAAGGYLGAGGAIGSSHPAFGIALIVLLVIFFLMFFFSVFLRRSSCALRFDFYDNPEGQSNHNTHHIYLHHHHHHHEAGGLDHGAIQKLPIVVYDKATGAWRGEADSSATAKSQDTNPEPQQGKISEDETAHVTVDMAEAEAEARLTECVVCLSAYEEGEVLRMLPRCRHCFHPECIDMWLFSHSTCPLCRCSLLPLNPASAFSLQQKKLLQASEAEAPPSELEETTTTAVTSPSSSSSSSSSSS